MHIKSIQSLSCKFLSSFKRINFLLELHYGSLSFIDFSSDHILGGFILVLLFIIWVLLNALFSDLETQEANLFDQIHIFLHYADIFVLMDVRIFLKILFKHIDRFFKIILLIPILLFNLTIHLDLNDTLRTELVLQISCMLDQLQFILDQLGSLIQWFFERFNPVVLVWNSSSLTWYLWL